MSWMTSISRHLTSSALVALLVLAALLAGVLGWRLGLGGIPAVVLGLGLTVLQSLVGRSASWVVRGAPLRRLHLASSLGTVGGASLAAGGLLVAVALPLAWLLGATGETLGREWPWLLGLGAGSYFLTAAWSHALQARREAQDAQADALEAALYAREAELAAVHARLNPHFLFNALNSIAVLVGSDPQAGRQMCMDLADFLRARLDTDPSRPVTLAEELRITRQYLAIERVRFADRLQWREDVAPETLALAVPPLTLQPLVENALKHGIARLEDGGTVTLSAAVQGSDLVLTVDNPVDGTPRPASRRGHGLTLVRKRLEAHHGDAARLVVDIGPGRHRVTLTLPARNAEAP